MFLRRAVRASAIGLIVIALAMVAALGRDACAVEPPLVTLASAKFPELTSCERAVLAFIDIDSIHSGDFAACGMSSKPDDYSNDPSHADQWGRQRDIRASLIEWLCAKREVSDQVDPRGIRILGARIVGSLDLSYFHVPFPIVMRKCAIGERMELIATTIPHLDLSGSHTAEIEGQGLNVGSDLIISGGINGGLTGGDFHASGQVDLTSLKVAGSLVVVGGHFRHSQLSKSPYEAFLNSVAMSLSQASVAGLVVLCCGSEADGSVNLTGARIGQDLHLYGGHFSNPNNIAVWAEASTIEGDVLLNAAWDRPLESDGIVDFSSARINSNFFANQARFTGGAKDNHGLNLAGVSIKGVLLLFGAEFRNGATLDLSGATSGYLIDDEASWPAQGKLRLDGFSYPGFYAGGAVPASPWDARRRLRWLSLQPGFHPQPYRQLAKVLRDAGDDRGATQVLIAERDARYAGYPLPVRIGAAVLKVTIGYGHRPLLAIFWMVAVVIVGWGVVVLGKRAGVMRLTWPETTPPPSGDPGAGLSPLLYSLDVFLPFVNLHQEHYWWPDESTAGTCRIAGLDLPVRGSLLRTYLWLQIIAGWLLSAIFLAGVTGLLRND